jgi:hypothetical protein
VLYLHYSEVQKDPAANAKRIGDFLGGHLDVDAMAEAVDPELWRNRAAKTAKK